MKTLALLLLSIAVAAPLCATSQAPDVLKIDGKTYSLHTNPLEPVLAAHPDRLPKAEVRSSGLWRGYIATWSVRESRLYLDDVGVPTKASMDADAPKSKQFRSAMKNLFDDPAPRVATWFRGNLIVPTGDIVDYVHMGYASTYSSYLVLTIVDGEVRKRRELDAAEFAKFRRAQYEAFRKTPEYAQLRAEAAKEDDPMPDEQIEQFLFQFASEAYLSRIFEP